MKALHPYSGPKQGNFVFKPRKLTESKISSIAKMHQSGQHILRLALKNNISPHCLRGLLRRRGYSLRGRAEATALRKNKCDDSFFHTIDSERKAYWLGFIAADGCVTKNRNQHVLSITLSAVDSDHLRKFLKDIKSNSKVYIYKAQRFGGNHVMANVGIRSEKIFQDLLKHKIRPCKSGRELISKAIPKRLWRHFFRGYVDGDGGWSSVDTVNPGPTLNVLAGVRFLRGLRKWFGAFGGIGWPKIKKKVGIYTISYTGRKQVGLIASILYKGSRVYLDRKMEIVNRLLNNIKKFPGRKNTVIG